jgi:hypothetical protein
MSGAMQVQVLRLGHTGQLVIWEGGGRAVPAHVAATR